MDPETGLDAVRKIVVRDGKIVAISADRLDGVHTIDAAGHVVAPGFVDCHVHTVDAPLSQKMMLRGGLTTLLDLEAGAYPVDRFSSGVTVNCVSIASTTGPLSKPPETPSRKPSTTNSAAAANQPGANTTASAR